ncbi:MAG: hypothetical protein KME27_12540 [Lyngbya sp. HA4199-MV5]|nr:hypothetical protein [Lyngbya sp. HA4199-MV5]
MKAKTDVGILKVVSAAINRHSKAYPSWQYTRFWDDLYHQVQTYLSNHGNLAPKELPILVMFIDEATWTLVSSQAVRYANEGLSTYVLAKEIEAVQYGDFKGYLKQLEQVSIHSKSGLVHQVVYETGNASIGFMYALQTLQQLHYVS